MTVALAGGRYELGAVLGTGGMAQVRRATDLVLGRDVAVKIFREDLDEGSAARVRTEMQTLAALTHPHLVAVHDAGTFEQGQPYLVMELVEGLTLADRCRERPLRVDEVATLGAELADALGYVHGRGVVHRDVKPANVLLSPRGVKLADFGIARIVDSVGHTSTGMTVGTAPYLSPEQVTGEQVGPAADIYALGLVLLECLTGRREYTGTSVETAVARLHRQPDVPVDLPAPWPGLLTAMTARDPAARPSAIEVRQVLRAGTPPTELLDPPTELLDPPTELLDPPTRRLDLPTAPRVARVVTPTARVRREGPRRAVLAGAAGAVALIGVLAVTTGGDPTSQPAVERHIAELQDAVGR